MHELTYNVTVTLLIGNASNSGLIQNGYHILKTHSLYMLQVIAVGYTILMYYLKLILIKVMKQLSIWNKSPKDCASILMELRQV
jgi:hypothetical protein